MSNIVKELFGKSKPKENAIDSWESSHFLLTKMLAGFQEIDNQAQSEKSLIALKSTKQYPKYNKDSSITKSNAPEKPVSLLYANSTIVFYLMNLSLEEFHESFKRFYREFDKNESSHLDKDEFSLLLDHFGNSKNMGKEKIKKSFKICDEEAYKEYSKFATKKDSSFLDNELKQKFFDWVCISVPVPGEGEHTKEIC